MAGFIYILSNPSMPGLVKIGVTDRHPHERMANLYTTGLPTRFRLELAIYCNEAWDCEQTIHEQLSEFRISKSREFFRVDVGSAIKAVIDEVLCSHCLSVEPDEVIPDRGELNQIADGIGVHPFLVMRILKHVPLDAWARALQSFSIIREQKMRLTNG